MPNPVANNMRWFIGAVALLGASSVTVAQEAPFDEVTISMDHSHTPIAVPEDAPVPSLSLVLHKDALSGFNLELQTERFSLMPPPPAITNMHYLMTATTDSNSGFVEGHAHLYVNGEKIQRLYGRNVHLPATLFRAGINQVTVSINSHSHMYWTVDDRQVLATLFINPAAENAVVYSFESFPIGEPPDAGIATESVSQN